MSLEGNITAIFQVLRWAMKQFDLMVYWTRHPRLTKQKPKERAHPNNHHLLGGRVHHWRLSPVEGAWDRRPAFEKIRRESCKCWQCNLLGRLSWHLSLLHGNPLFWPLIGVMDPEGRFCSAKISQWSSCCSSISNSIRLLKIWFVNKRFPPEMSFFQMRRLKKNKNKTPNCKNLLVKTRLAGSPGCLFIVRSSPYQNGLTDPQRFMMMKISFYNGHRNGCDHHILLPEAMTTGHWQITWQTQISKGNTIVHG